MNAKSKNQITILFVEDDDDDFSLIQDAIAEVNIEGCIKRVKDGEEFLNYLLHISPFESLENYPLPDIIFLDLNLPKIDGREALKQINATPELKKIPIIILTTSNSPQDIEVTYKYGANSYVQKPSSYNSLVAMFKTMKSYWLEIAELPGISPN